MSKTWLMTLLPVSVSWQSRVVSKCWLVTLLPVPISISVSVSQTDFHFLSAGSGPRPGWPVVREFV